MPWWCTTSFCTIFAKALVFIANHFILGQTLNPKGLIRPATRFSRGLIERSFFDHFGSR